MTMTSTSLQAYEKVKLTKNEEAVYEVLCDLGVATNDDIASKLGWPIHCVTGRTNNLWKKSMVAVVDHSGISAMGNKAKRWAVIDPNDRQLKLISELDCGV